MGKQYSIDFKNQVLSDYKTGKYGGRYQLAQKYNLSPGTVWHWIEKDRKQGNQINDINYDYLIIKEIFDDSKDTYGYRRICEGLKIKYGVIFNHKLDNRYYIPYLYKNKNKEEVDFSTSSNELFFCCELFGVHFKISYFLMTKRVE